MRTCPFGSSTLSTITRPWGIFSTPHDQEPLVTAPWAAGGGVCCGMHGRGSAWRSCSIAHCGGSGWHAGGVAGIDERVCVANMRCARLGQRQAVCVVVGGDVAGARRAVDGGAAKHRLCGGETAEDAGGARAYRLHSARNPAP